MSSSIIPSAKSILGLFYTAEISAAILELTRPVEPIAVAILTDCYRKDTNFRLVSDY
jgi:hypothetical protein